MAEACGHDHGADAIAARLCAAEAVCARQGARFTELRRDILASILQSERPVGAYELLDRLKGRRAAPPTVYRTLDFLLAQGLIHRLERLNAFVGCVAHEGHRHAVQFLICQGCGSVAELDDAEVEEALDRAAARRGFRVGTRTIELEGLCAACLASA